MRFSTLKEEKMKTFAKLLVIAMALIALVACTTPAAPQATPAPVVDAAQDAWLKAAEFGKYAPAKQDWAAIEAAAKKEGKVLVYANSSRIADEKKLFEAKYPGITLEGFDLGGEDAVLKVREEQKAGAFTGDVLFTSSAAGDISMDMLPKQQLWKFIPDELASKFPAEATTPLVVSRYGVRVLGFNGELNKTCPVGNWWELTEAAWKGKVFIEDPLNDASTMAIYTTIVAHGKELAAAYKDKYGKDPSLDADTPDAGWLWLKKFAQNKPVPQPGGDEVTAAFASKGMKDNLVGFTSYSKYRNTVAGKVVFEPCKTLKPVMGVQTASYVSIINRAPHPNAAKLFINFVLSKEGHEPWNVIGDYSPRTDLDSPKGAIPYAELGKVVWSIDESYVFKNIAKVRDFYAINVLAR
jgi:iron(III) transport system substrate-binding protein